MGDNNLVRLLRGLSEIFVKRLEYGLARWKHSVSRISYHVGNDADDDGGDEEEDED